MEEEPCDLTLAGVDADPAAPADRPHVSKRVDTAAVNPSGRAGAAEGQDAGPGAAEEPTAAAAEEEEEECGFRFPCVRQLLVWVPGR